MKIEFFKPEQENWLFKYEEETEICFIQCLGNLQNDLRQVDNT